MIALTLGDLAKVKPAFRFALLIALSVFATLPAAAQQGGKDDARRFFNSGQKAFQAGRFVEAAKAFEEAFRLKPHAAALINAGDAWEKAGDSALAARTYQRVIELEQASEQDRSDATDRLAKLAPKLGVIELKGDSGLRARVDEDEFHGGQRVYVTAAEHVVALLDVDGAKQRKLTLAAGSTRTVDLEKLKPSDEPKGGGATGGGTEPTSDTGTPTEDQPPMKKGGVRAGTWLMFGLTAVAAGGAVYFGLQVNDAEKKYNDKPNKSDFDRFNQDKLYTNIGIGVAVVSAGIGMFLLVKDLNRKVPAKKAALPVRVSFDVAPLMGGGVLVSRGEF